ncbi:TLD-domain-containing protein [Absidia repens]|uniref:Oxidation resistance protein 1 n=1 Tax=Absidia repens TaxID=90262 RepID=A0A1X2IYA0_9FUNG|nr:TLD-domain-containing protein [Absidia repens]
MDMRLPLSSSSLMTTSSLDTSSIHCNQFSFSNNHSLSRQLDRVDVSPHLLPTSTAFIPNSSVSGELVQQLYLTDTASLITMSTPSTTDNQWFDLSDQLCTILDDDEQEDGWSLITANSPTNGKSAEIKGTTLDSRSLQLVSRYQTTRPVLEKYMAEKILSWLPRRVVASQHQWRLLYSLDQHGASIQTLYHRVGNKGPCLLAIQDDDGDIFGAFISESMKVSTSFYGSGESFLWKVKQLMIGKQQVGCLERYPWTSKNNYFIYSDKNLIGFGNGNGQFGLCLDEGIENGTTSPCPTFDNPCLASSANFKCIGLEVWAVS